MGKSIVLPRAITNREDIGNMGNAADNTTKQAGSALTIERISNNDFDAVVYGECQRCHWMAGSMHFWRIVNPTPGFRQEEVLAKVQIAITYTN